MVVVVVDAGCLLGWLVWSLFVLHGLVLYLLREGDAKSHQGGDTLSLPLVDDGLMVGGTL